ncbi:MAG: hypothetical protein B6241_05410 [Spirochaetaceae bacterium 4572_59]|nr:MAG: hypothetical protein B6241_05410 [Spirochaetaceae bacterium 4572_59]
MKRFSFVLVLLQFTIISAWGQTGSALFQEGRDAFSDKFFSRAIESFREFIESYPSDPRVDQADYMVGVSYFYLKRFNESIRHFSQYEKDYPASAYLKRIHYWKGLSYYADGIYRQAIAEFKKQSEYKDEIYFLQKSYQFLAYCYEKNEEAQKALQAYEDLINLNPEKNVIARAMERQGVLYLNQGEYERALSLFSNLTVDHRDIPHLLKEVTFYMGECYYQLGDPKKSISKFESFLSLYSESENREKAIFRLGSLYALNDNQESAKEYMKLLNNEYPDSEYSMDAHIVLAESYLQSGDMETARASLNTLLDSETDPVEIQKIQYNLARTWEKEPTEALKYYLMAAKGLDPDLASESLYQSGRLYDEKGEKERTILLYERLFTQYKESSYRELVGEWMAVYYDRNNQDLALKNHLDRMLTDYPETLQKVLYLYMRGNIAYREGDYNAALRSYQNILNVKSEDETLSNEARYRIGYIYTLRKEFSRAKGYFKQILTKAEEGELYYRALLSTGICSLNIMETEDAAEAFTSISEAVNSAVWKGDAFYYLGQIAMEQGNYYKSVENFSLSVESALTDQRRAEALYQLGWSQLRLARFKEAADSFDRMAADYPEHRMAPDSLYRAGIALSYREEWEASLTRFLPALEMIEYASMREELLYQIAWSYFMMEKFSGAMEYLQELESEFPESPLPADGLFRAAEALQEKGKTDSAVYAYTQVFHLFPYNPLSETSLFRALSFTENLPERLTLMKEYLQSYASADNSEKISRLIASSIKERVLNPVEEGLIADILALPLSQGDQVRIQLALYFHELDKPETMGSLKELEKLENLEAAERKRILLYMGLSHMNMGNTTQAETLFQSLLDTDSPDIAAEAQFYLAAILSREGRWKDAADSYLRIRYRYSEQREWVSRALYEASRAYQNAGDKESYNRSSEMLKTEYPDSEWTVLMRDPAASDEPFSSDESTVSEADPDELSPSDEILPILEGE